MAERTARDFVQPWQAIEELLIAKCEPAVYAEIVPLAEALFTGIEQMRAEAMDRTFGEGYRLGRAQGQQEAERQFREALAIRDDLIVHLKRGCEVAEQARAGEVASVSALAAALETGDWGARH